MWKKLVLVSFIVMICGSAFATQFRSNSSLTKVHTEPNEMDTIGVPFNTQKWANYKATDSYVGVVDRHVLSTQDWQNDPSILYAGPKRVYKPQEQVITKIVRVDEVEVDEKDSTSTRIQFCDENNNCGEWRDQ